MIRNGLSSCGAFLRSVFAPVFLALVLLTFATTAMSAVDAPAERLIVSEYIARAKALIARGDNESAWSMLMRVLREEPDNMELNKLLVETGFATGRDNQAIAALERMVEYHPDNAELRKALAKAYDRAGDEAAAAEEIKEAERLQPGIVSGHLPQKKSRKENPFSCAGRLTLGFSWNRNPTGGLDNLEVSVGDMSFTMIDDAGVKPSTGEFGSVSLNAGYSLGETWHLIGDVQGMAKLYNRELPSNQRFYWGRAALGIRNLGVSHMAESKVYLDKSVLDPWDEINALGCEATAVYAPLQFFQIIAKGSIDDKKYMVSDDKDGTYWNTGLYGRFLFGPSCSFLLGGKVLGASAEIERWSYDGWEALASLDLYFLERLGVSPYASYRETYYHAPATALSDILGESRRYDRSFSAGTSFTWKWNKNLSQEFGIQYTDNKSNSAFYRYGELQLSSAIVLSF